MSDAHIKQLEDKIARLEQKLYIHTTAQSLMQVSTIYPKKNTVVFVGRDYFGDNIKYAFLAFLQYARGKGIDVYFLTEDPVQQRLLKTENLPCLSSSDPDYAMILLGAKVAVLCDSFYPMNAGGAAPHALLQGAKFIQLWHGIPIKEVGLQNFCQPEVMQACGNIETLVATSAGLRTEWAQRFAFNTFAPIGYPRNDVFFREPSKTDLINTDTRSLNRIQTAKRDGKSVVIYTPTFRDLGGISWFDRAEISKLAAHCRAHNIVFCVNLHPAEQAATVEFCQSYPNIWFLAPYTDIYPLVKYADVVVTDYSSLALDFLLLDRPLVFYRPDHADYVAKSRNLVPNYERYSAGAVTFSITDLLPAIDAAVAASRNPSTDPFKKTRHALRKTLFDHVDGNAATRVNKLIEKQLKVGS